MLTRRNLVAAILAITINCAIIGAIQAQPAVVSPELAQVRRELDGFRESLKQAAEMRDISRMRTLFTETFTHTHASGRVNDKDATSFR